MSRVPSPLRVATLGRRGFAPLCAALVAACADTAPRVTPATIDAAAPAGPASTAPNYIIGPGDTLNVFVYRSPELSASSLPVRPDGRISLPLVPDIEAAGRTPTQLARDIEQRLRQYVLEPNVSVMVQNFVGAASQQIRVIGEAAQPMTLPYREGMTLLDVMIGVRGLTRYAAGNRAELIRRLPNGATETTRVRLGDLMRNGDVSQDVAMRPGDTLVIPQSWF